MKCGTQYSRFLHYSCLHSLQKKPRLQFLRWKYDRNGQSFPREIEYYLGLTQSYLGKEMDF
jgi:hypothetical protein